MTTKQKKSLGETLRELRIGAGLEQKELGKLIGVTGNAVCNYESDIRIPKDEIKVAYAKVFNKSVQDLFYL